MVDTILIDLKALMVEREDCDAGTVEKLRAGLAQGKTLVLDDMDEMYYVYDLAIYTAPPDRSRAIDRYAKSARFEAQSDERLMLEAMRASQFAILLIEQRHDTVGLIATDILRNSKVWLLDVRPAFRRSAAL